MITPIIWGPHFWNFFHSISLKYPDFPSTTDKVAMKELINSIPYVLPCKKCSKHFKENLEEFKLKDEDLKDKRRMIDWFINFHNIVNLSLKKSLVLKENAIKNLNSLKHLKYFDQFKKVLGFIEHEIDNDIKSDTCHGIKKFVRSTMHFGGINSDKIKFDFYDYQTWKDAKKLLFLLM
jgi:hypothetical protein